MKIILKNIILFISILGFLLSDPYKPLDIDFLKENPTANPPEEKQINQKPKSDNPKAFENIVKGFNKIEGLFTFYEKSEENKVYLELHPDQFDVIYTINITRETGDGARFHGVSMQGEYPFYLKKNGNVIQFVEKNVKLRSVPKSKKHRYFSYLSYHYSDRRQWETRHGNRSTRNRFPR